MTNAFSPLPHLDIAPRPELPPPNDGPVQWRERWSLVLQPFADSPEFPVPVPVEADLQFDLPDRLTMLQDGEVSGVITGRVIAPPLTPAEGTVLSRGTVSVKVGNVSPLRALSLELCWTAPDGKFCMLAGNGSGLRVDNLDGIQLGLRLSWRKESPLHAVGQSMTFLLTRILHPSQLPAPPPPPDGLWKRLTGRFRR